ncbi:hypothetical protein FGB62_193g034 [Gracilaria domingensis]|nr:hypothetical protein FGB62_193g034 [Gracilaria domingensis]
MSTTGEGAFGMRRREDESSADKQSMAQRRMRRKVEVTAVKMDETVAVSVWVRWAQRGVKRVHPAVGAALIHKAAVKLLGLLKRLVVHRRAVAVGNGRGNGLRPLRAREVVDLKLVSIALTPRRNAQLYQTASGQMPRRQVANVLQLAPGGGGPVHGDDEQEDVDGDERERGVRKAHVERWGAGGSAKRARAGLTTAAGRVTSASDDMTEGGAARGGARASSGGKLCTRECADRPRRRMRRGAAPFRRTIASNRGRNSSIHARGHARTCARRRRDDKQRWLQPGARGAAALSRDSTRQRKRRARARACAPRARAFSKISCDLAAARAHARHGAALKKAPRRSCCR